MRMTCLLAILLATPVFADLRVERVSTKVYFPRGLAELDGKILSLCRGRVRDMGGANSAIADQAGTLYLIDPAIAQPVSETITDAIMHNGTILAEPTSPPFILLNRALANPTDDRMTDRPYCCLRYDPVTRNIFVCGFSGIDRHAASTSGGAPGSSKRSFSKNLSDAIFRYDLRNKTWHEVERHDSMAGGSYPHHDPHHHAPPHGWLNGPDNLAVVGRWLYACAKDNSVIVRYDLAPLRDNPNVGPLQSNFVVGPDVAMRQADGSSQMQRHEGYSMLHSHGGYFYAGCRTSSTILRFALKEDGTLKEPAIGELVARFMPFDPASGGGKSAELTDMDFDAQGRLYVISAKPTRVYRFTPDPKHVFDATSGGGEVKPWADVAALTGNPNMKGENVLVDSQGRVYVTSGDAYGHETGYGGAIYRITESAQIMGTKVPTPAH